MKTFFLFLLILLTVACSHTQETSVTALEKQTNALVEEKNVIKTVNRLFVSTDNRDWEGVKACFADEVVLDMTSVMGGEPNKLTPQQIADGWAQGLKGLKAIHHQAGNYDVSLKADEADVFCYGIAFHYLPNVTGQNSRTFVGSYNFHLKKIGPVWKIDIFKYNLKFIDGNLELHKYVK
ncbi:MAG: nuclear transport factor 2 family protein [Desulfobacterales bacterium]|nr:nuclear transport factor 2 family protein [Desulfobacterales bacterium]